MAKNIKRFTKPQEVVDGVNPESGLPTGHYRPRERYVYAHYEMGWEFDKELGFLPTLSMIKATRGINGVGDDGSLTRALDKVRKKGGVVIHPDEPRLPEEFRNYLCSYPTDTGGKWFVNKWEEATVLRNGAIRWNSDESQPIWREFRKSLLENKIIEPLSPEVYSFLRDRTRKMQEKYRSRGVRDPVAAEKADKLKEQLDLMEEEWEKLMQPTKPKKKTKSKKSKSKKITKTSEKVED